MAKFRRSVLFCLVLTITFVAASQKILQRVDRNKASEEVESLKHVKPQEVIGTFGKYMKKFSTEAIGVEYIQVGKAFLSSFSVIINPFRIECHV